MTGKIKPLASALEQICSLSQMRAMGILTKTFYEECVWDVLSSMPVPNMPSSTKSTDSGVT